MRSTYFRVDVVSEKALEYLGGLEMVTIGEIQTTLEKLGFVRVVHHFRLLLRGQQAHDRRKVIFLVEIVENLAVMRGS